MSIIDKITEFWNALPESVKAQLSIFIVIPLILLGVLLAFVGQKFKQGGFVTGEQLKVLIPAVALVMSLLWALYSQRFDTLQNIAFTIFITIIETLVVLATAAGFYNYVLYPAQEKKKGKMQNGNEQPRD